MEQSKLFRGLIVVQFLTILAFLLVGSVDPIYVEAPINSLDIASFIWVILLLISWVLLFRFKSSGKPLYTASVFIGIPISLALPAYSIPYGNAELLLEWFAGVLDGAMLAMLYLTSLKDRFNKVDE